MRWRSPKPPKLTSREEGRFFGCVNTKLDFTNHRTCMKLDQFHLSYSDIPIQRNHLIKGTVLTRYEDRFRLIELHRVEWGSKLHDAIRQNCIFNTNNLWGRRI